MKPEPTPSTLDIVSQVHAAKRRAALLTPKDREEVLARLEAARALVRRLERERHARAEKAARKILGQTRKTVNPSSTNLSRAWLSIHCEESLERDGAQDMTERCVP